jgi:hypothetical protein
MRSGCGYIFVCEAIGNSKSLFANPMLFFLHHFVLDIYCQRSQSIAIQSIKMTADFTLII